MFSKLYFRFILLSICGLLPQIIVAQNNNPFGYPVQPDTISACTESVGSPAGNFSISDMGGATYSIDIEAPVGLPGAQPKIGIAYNSQAGNGVAGYGCNISGLSVITRGSRNIYFDEHAKGIDYSKDDAFYLDGQRMIRLEYESVGDSAVYCLESDPYIRIVAHNLSSTYSSNLWFYVITKDGIRYNYGTTTASVRSNNNSGRNFAEAWYITKMIYPTGNYIDYGYTKDCLFVYPSYVSYGQNISASNSLHNRIDFVYESRSDISQFTVHGERGQVRKLLKEIKTFSDNVLYRKYSLSYDSISDSSTTKFSRLISVNESNGNNESLKPITLSWQYLPSFNYSGNTIPFDINQTENTHFTTIESGTSQLFSADLNGDGISDIIKKAEIKYRPGDGYVHDNSGMFLYMSQLDNNGNVSYEGPSFSLLPPNIPFWNYWTCGPMVCDFNGDGVNDIFVPSISAGINNYIQFFFYNGGICTGHNYAPSLNYLMQNLTNVPVYTCCDFDKDGKSDILVLETGLNGSGYEMCIYKGCTRFEDVDTIRMNIIISGEPKRIFTSDYNKDGLNDILVVYNNGYCILWNKGGILSSTTFSESSAYSNTHFGNSYRLYEGDFNGDGLTDFLSTREGNAQWNFYLGKGNGTFRETQACYLSNVYKKSDVGERDGKYFTCMVYDMDADGKSDVYISKAKYDDDDDFQQVYTYWLTSTGESLVVKNGLTSDDKDNASISYHLLGDFNGDGLLEAANYGDNNYSGGNLDDSLHIYRLQDYSPNSGKITSVTNGYGNNIKISYTSLTNPKVYKNERNTNYPIKNCTIPYHVVNETRANTGTEYADTITYYYKNLRFHLEGKGLLGFGTFQKTDMTLLTRNIRDVVLDMGSYTPSEITKSTIIGNATAYNIVNYSYSQPHNGLKSYYCYPDSSVETDLDGNVVRQYFTYDATKNYALTQSIVSHADGYIKTQYQSFTRRFKNYLPTRIIKETQYTGQDAFIEKKALSYNINGLVVMDKKRFDTGHFMSTTYTYDSYGNIKTKKDIPENGSSLTTSYKYDSTNRFIVLMTEQVNKKTYYTYDNWGNILTKSDKTRPSYPQTTQYTYDGWNNVKTELSYTGQLTTYTRGWNSDGSSFLVTQGTGQPWKKECYDRLGKIIYEQSISVLNLALEDSFQYGQRGELVRHKSTKGSGTWQSDCSEYYEYDIRGRIKKIERSNNPTITYSYSPNTVTSTKNGHTVEKKYDLWGNIKKVTDSSGIVSYTYGSHGQPLEISYDGKTISISYDDLGRKASMNDPDAGTTRYTYDDFDRLITECDALNHQTQNTYDANGFLTQSVTDGIITNYTYGQQASNRFQLLSTTRGYCSINYTYDNLGRIESERRRINGGDTLETRYTYNNIGQLSTKQYVGGPTVTYTYDAYGFEDEIKCNNILISKPLEHTGAMLSEKRGTSLMKETWIYNNGKVSDLCMGSNVNMSNPDYWLIYYYDDGSGNMERRIGMFPWYEDFTYDSLDRLTLIEGNRDHNITYAPDGNITYQTGIGHYYYDGTKPHAVTLVENTDHKIPFATLNTTYNSFGKIQTIENESGTTSISFVYGPDNERWKSVMNRPIGGTRTIYYMGDCEKIVENGHTRRLYYLDGDVIYIKQDNLSGSIYFTFKDHLGSIVAIVDYNGNEVFKAAYDAWGNRTLYRNDINFHRGYTGHEMLPEFGLINMNGRLYDPLLGRFLSTDNFVQEPTNSQNFNRYTYCLNNPLKYTDPSGNIIFSLLSAIFAPELMLVAIQLDQGWMTGGFMASMNNESFSKGAITGLLTSALNTTIFSIGGSSMNFFQNVGLGALEGAASGAFEALLKDEDIFSEMKSGAFNGALFSAFTSDEFLNFTNGKGFKSNDAVFRDFENGKYGSDNWQQKVLDYFGFEGTFDPNNKIFMNGRNNNPAETFLNTGETVYNYSAFYKGYDHLHCIAFHEMQHRNHILEGLPDRQDFASLKNYEEYRTCISNYKNQGLYLHHGFNLESRINVYGTALSYYDDIIKYTYGYRPWWHFIYKIPRRW